MTITRFTRGQSGERLYYKFEDEVLVEKAVYQFEWKTVYKEEEEERSGKEVQYKLVYILNYNDYVLSMGEIKQAALDF